MKDKPRANLNKNYFILTSKNLTYYEGKTGEVLYHWSINGWLEEKKVVLETLTGIRRAGADIIFTYYARDAARWLAEENPGRVPSIATK